MDTSQKIDDHKSYNSNDDDMSTLFIDDHKKIYKTSTVPKGFISEIVSSDDHYDKIDTYEKYDSLFRIRHDFAHWCLCSVRNIPFGERRIKDIPELNQISIMDNWELIYNQTPDIIRVDSRNVFITEITVSNSRLAEREKVTKYSLLVDVLKKSGFEVDLEIICFSVSISSPAIDDLVKNHHIPIEWAMRIYNMISKITKFIHRVESTQEGQSWHARRAGETFADVDITISDDQIREYYDKCEFKPFKDSSHLDNMLKHNPSESTMLDSDNEFIDTVVEEVIDMKTTFNSSHEFESSIRSLRVFQSKNQTHKAVRAFLPLPYLNQLDTDSSKRSTESDEKEFVIFKSKLLDSNDSFLKKISEMSDHKGKINLSESEKYTIALEGPGRKKFVKKGSPPHIDRQKKNRNFWFDYQLSMYENDLDSLSYELSKITNFILDSPSSSEGLGLNYIRCCQSIFREISINSMRKDRRHNFIFKPTGVNGVFLLLFPGPKMRTGENLSTIWFRLFADPSKIPINYLSSHWAFKRWRNHGTFLMTDFISTDANRLDHYLRCYDRILMSYLSYIHGGTGHLIHDIKDDTSNTLGVMILIYMENRRSTSKMLQDVRYLVMGSISKFRWWRDLLSKYHEPIRSCLQAYLLSKIEKYSIDIHTNLVSYVKGFKFGKAYQDSDVISDRLAGIISELPRVLTKGGKITFKQLLCEMYFTMLFNKNQDDPTHATFQILNKMLDGEVELSEVKETTGFHMGSSNSLDDLRSLIHNPHKNQFSSRAIMIGSKLQSLELLNRQPAGLAHRKAAQNKSLNKPLSDFATYKSSAVFERGTYDGEVLTKRKYNTRTTNMDTLEEKFREGGDDNEDPITVKFTRQNPRRKCIEGIIDILINEGHHRSFDLVKDTICKEMYFQVFKKNQIGGVREILILPIEKRITINILESFSRLICGADQREMLTHGDIKFSLMRDIQRDIRRTDKQKYIILNYNLDKTRWGPSFMPIQFIYMFKPFAHYYPNLYNFLLLTLMVHTNKKCLIPEKLLHVWIRDPSNKIKHAEKALQNLKTKFLYDNKIYFNNESNMGQGILHYTSSYLHLCALSFRDEIYRKLCLKAGISPGSWRDIVSSDDSYTAQAIPMDGVRNINKRIELFMRSQEVTERLFNIWTSKSKSSVSFLISEFNSLFGSNLTVFPTLFKFALASVTPSNTDSFFRMVKESFNTTRQIVENGGSLELYMVAHKLNQVYCESIYHTYDGGCNDFRNIGLRRDFVPYQLGVYPIGDPGIMIMLGPESHNYRIMSKLTELTRNELNLFRSCHKLIPIENPELYSELNTMDNIFTGMLRIEAATGPVRKLQKIKRQIDMTWEHMKKMIENDMTCLLREPKTLMEVKLHTYQKLFSYGASEALKQTAASVYYARVSATVSSQAFHIPYHDSMSAKYNKKERRFIGHTYLSCLNFLVNLPNEGGDLEMFYPNMNVFKGLSDIGGFQVHFQRRNQFESQNLRSLQLTEISIRVKNPIRDLIESFWLDPESEKETSYYRDWVTLKELVPLISDSLPETLDHFPGQKCDKVKYLLLILMRIMGNANKPMKANVYGPSSRSYDQTYLTLVQQNMFHNYTNNDLIESPSLDIDPVIHDKLFMYYNIFVLRLIKGLSLNIELNDIDLGTLLRDNTLHNDTKKRVMMMLMYLGYLDDYPSWTNQTHSIFHYWIKRQHRDRSGEWRGDFKLIVQCGKNKLLLKKQNNKYFITLNELSNPMLNFELFKESLSLVQLTMDDILPKLQKGRFAILSDRILPLIDPNGVHIDVTEIDNISIDVGSIYIDKSVGVRDMMVLNDINHNQIFRVSLGLLPTTYRWNIGEFEDFTVNGMRVSDMVRVGLFRNYFSYDDLNQDVAMSILEDLVVEKPRISDITKKRLSGLVDNWDTKKENEYYDDADFKFIDNPIDMLISTPIDQRLIGFVEESIQSDDVFDSLLSGVMEWDLVSSLPTVQTQQLPQKILDRILFCKYNIISRSCADPRLISRASISNIYNQYRDKYLVYAMVFMYDKLFHNTEIKSPDDVRIDVRGSFVRKFGLRSREEQID